MHQQIPHSFHFKISASGEGNGNPLHCSSLENPRDGRAWWVAIYGDAQRGTWLKWLSSSSRSSLVLRTSLSAASWGSSVTAAHWLFHPVLSWCRSQALGHPGSVVVAHRLSYPGAFAVFPNQVSNTYLKHWIKRENTLEGIGNKPLLHEKKKKKNSARSQLL